MWLIDSTTLRLQEVIDPEDAGLRYAILSHTWGSPQEEVSFKDFSNLEQARKKGGFAKIEKTCELARSHGIQYAWVDTCCIDKSSSAELSEAINSMFLWYRLSEVCYIYLSDLNHEPYDASRWQVASSDQVATGNSDASTTARDDHFLNSNFAKCRWFTRGWTLQELIAPRKAVFYDARWQRFATKHDITPILSLVTGINEDILVGKAALGDVPIFTRMSWAAKRNTTRVEDTAYCLLGIFDVNLPLIYGEGSKAFRRLQEEIIRKTEDLSILAWSGRNPPEPRYRPRAFQAWTPESGAYRGALAWAPCEFVTPSKQRYFEPVAERATFAPAESLELKGSRAVIVYNACVIHRRSKLLSTRYSADDILQLPCLDGFVYRMLRRCPTGFTLDGPALSREELVTAEDDMYEMKGTFTKLTLLDVFAPQDVQDLQKPVVEIGILVQKAASDHISYLTRSQPVWPVTRWSDLDQCFTMHLDELLGKADIDLVAVQHVRHSVVDSSGKLHGLDILCCFGTRPISAAQAGSSPFELLVTTLIHERGASHSVGRSDLMESILNHASTDQILHWVDRQDLLRRLREEAAENQAATRLLTMRGSDGSAFEVALSTDVWKGEIDARRLKYFVKLELSVFYGLTDV